MLLDFEGRATLINDTDKLYSDSQVTLIGGKDLKFNDLNMIDFLLQNNTQPPQPKHHMQSKGAMRGFAMAEMAMADDSDMGNVTNNALDNLFVYKLKNVEMGAKSRSSHSFMDIKGVGFI